MTSRSDLVIPGAALARDFLSGGDVDHVQRQVRKFGREGCREVVAAGFDKNQLHVGECALQTVDGLQVDRSILADRRVRTASGFNAHDAFWR